MVDQQPTSTPDFATSRPDQPDEARWKVHGGRTMYESDWVNVHLDDVELPDGAHIEHHVLDFPRGSAGAILLDHQDRALLIWRHRFITNTWGWEVPAGWIDDGEDPVTAVAREIEEETGYKAGRITSMVIYHPLAGISNQTYWTYIATDPTYCREVAGENETAEVRWFSLTEVSDLVRTGQITDGPSLLILSAYMAHYLAKTDH